MHKVTREQHPTDDPPGGDLPGGDLPGAAQLNPFVINLCSSTSPVALTPPDHAGLKRFTFFVSRRREESRERFRLHMGYFDTQEEAERLLDIVREIYPGAWAGLAPGQRLRAAAAQQQQAAAQSVRVAEVTPAPLEPLPGLEQAPISSAHISLLLEPPPVPTPVLEPAPALAPELSLAPSVHPSLAPSLAPSSEMLQDTLPQPVPTLAATPHIDELTLLPDAGRLLPAAAEPSTDDAAATRSLLEVRAAIAALDDSGEQPPVLQPIPELKPTVKPHHVDVDVDADPISEAVALALLESGRRETPGAVGAADAARTAPAAVNPSGVGAAAIGAAPLGGDGAARPDRPCYAVQLMWSVQPLDAAKVPQLAIFSAYTLYGAEGNRDGRRWYGLRLGFFTDAVSAKQVAHYVRSEFSTVSVVPVTVRERERAKLATQRSPASAARPAAGADIVLATATRAPFEFIEDNTPEPTPAAKAGGARSSRGAPGKRARLRPPGGSVKGNARVKPMTLEETLEILGAGELRVDNSRGPLINQSGAAHTEAKPGKNKESRLGRLFDRLAERLGS